MIIELALTLALDAGVATTLAPLVRELVQQDTADERADGSEEEAEQPSFPERIVWFTQLDQAFAEAERTNRPILLHSAAPACSGAPGMW